MGLIGLYQSSNYRDNISSVYMMSDEDTQSLYVFILFPGSYHDVYEIASLTTYTNIFIIPISLDPAYISDVYRLVNELHPIKSIVKVINPRKFTSQNCNTLFLNSFVKGNDKSSFVCTSNGFISFNWNENDPKYPPRLNDIYCTFGDRRVLLTSTKVDRDRIYNLFKNDLVDYVYVPWSKNPEYNSAITDNFLTLIDYEPLEEYIPKLVPYGFNSQAEIDLCQENYPNNFPVTIRHLFIDTTKEDMYETVVTWGEISGPHIPPFCNGKNHCPPPPPCMDCNKTNTCNCKCKCNTPEEATVDPIDAVDIAISTIGEYCKGFKDFVTKCDLGCENCKLKAFYKALESESSTDSNTGDNSSSSTTDPENPTDSKDDNKDQTEPTEPSNPDTDNTDQGSESSTDDNAETTKETTNTNADTSALNINNNNTVESIFT